MSRELTPGEQAAIERIATGWREYLVARLRLDIACSETAGALRDFAAAWQASEDRLTAEEARKIAEDPDMAELNVRLDALYDLP